MKLKFIALFLFSIGLLVFAQEVRKPIVATDQAQFDTKDTWQFAIVGDTHVPQSDILEKIVPRLIAEKIKVVVFVGDLIQGGKGQNGRGMQKQLETWMSMVQPLKDAGIKMITIRGNHEADVKGNSIEVWKQFFGPEMNVCQRYKNVTFIGLDNYIEGERTIDLAWFKKRISQAKGTLIVPFGHEPAFTAGTFHPRCLDANPDIRNAFWSILTGAGIKYYFCGHAHQYNLAKIEKDGKVLFQIVSGGGGGRLQRERNANQDADYKVQSKKVLSENGYLLVQVDSKSLTPIWRKL
ncbi:MAG: metallophosphoesterase [Lentisphaeria bacterium]